MMALITSNCGVKMVKMQAGRPTGFDQLAASGMIGDSLDW